MEGRKNLNLRQPKANKIFNFSPSSANLSLIITKRIKNIEGNEKTKK